jgi:SAM-dependent methyltransferase
MSDFDRQKWDRKYSGPFDHDQREPGEFLRTVLPDLPAGGVAFDLACGVGRHAVALAKHGLSVTGFDISSVGLERCRARAAEAQVDVQTVLCDLDDWHPEPASADVVVVVSYHGEGLAQRIRRALRPGGHVVYASFSIDQLKFEGGPRNADWLIQPGELLRAFDGFRIRRYEDVVISAETAPKKRARIRLHATA